MPNNYALPSSANYPSNPWVQYFNSLPDLSQRVMDQDDQDTSNVYTSVMSRDKGQSYRGWLSNYMRKYHDDYTTDMYRDPTQHYVDWLSSRNPNDDYNYASPFEKGVQAGGTYAPTMRMNWG